MRRKIFSKGTVKILKIIAGACEPENSAVSKIFQKVNLFYSLVYYLEKNAERGENMATKKTAKSASKPKAETLSCTSAELADMFGVTVQNITHLINEGTVVKIGRAKYDVVASVQNYIGKMRAREEMRKKTPQEVETQTALVKLDHEQFKARKTELQVLELEGKLHYTDDIRAMWNNIIVAAKSKLLAIGVKAAPVIAGETDSQIIKDIIDREVRDTLKEITDFDSTVIVGGYEISEDEDEEKDDGEENDE